MPFIIIDISINKSISVNGKNWIKKFFYFSESDDVKKMAKFVELFGYPPKNLIEESQKGDTFFYVYPNGVAFRLLPGFNQCYPKTASLEDAVCISDNPSFIQFLRCCFEMDPVKRLSAEQLLEHNWIKGIPTEQKPYSKCYLF